ncbi:MULTISPECIES: hypothetical protein [Nocardia]|uniref:hypothetical protein n=1 Tax=Nocardia TaxID=1817 RepID=UPI0024553D70|nr:MULTISPECIES: hypothetical protein [Nocardia]
MNVHPISVYVDGINPHQAFRRTVRTTTLAIHQAYYDELDHWTQLPDPDTKPTLDYGATIAAKTELLIVSDTPMPMRDAEALAEQVRDHHPRISEPDGPVGAIAVSGGRIHRDIDIDLTAHAADTTAPPIRHRDPEWEAHVAQTVITSRHPGETIEQIYSSAYDTDEHGRQRLRLFVANLGAPDQHTGWLMFGLAPDTAPAAP